MKCLWIGILLTVLAYSHATHLKDEENQQNVQTSDYTVHYHNYAQKQDKDQSLINVEYGEKNRLEFPRKKRGVKKIRHIIQLVQPERKRGQKRQKHAHKYNNRNNDQEEVLRTYEETHEHMDETTTPDTLAQNDQATDDFMQLQQEEQALIDTQMDATQQHQHFTQHDHKQQRQHEEEVEEQEEEKSNKKGEKIKIKHHHHHHHHNHVKEVIKKVPEPYPVEKIVHVPVEKVVHVPKPYAVEKIVHVPVEKIVEKKVPYAVEKIVEKIVEKKVPYAVEKIVHVPIEKIIEKFIHIPKPYPVEKIVEKLVHVPVEKIVEKIVHVPKPFAVEKIVNKIVHVPKPYPVIKPMPYAVEVKVPYEKAVPYPVLRKIPVPYKVEVEKKVPVPYKVQVEKKVPVYLQASEHYDQHDEEQDEAEEQTVKQEQGQSEYEQMGYANYQPQAQTIYGRPQVIPLTQPQLQQALQSTVLRNILLKQQYKNFGYQQREESKNSFVTVAPKQAPFKIHVHNEESQRDLQPQATNMELTQMQQYTALPFQLFQLHSMPFQQPLGFSLPANNQHNA